MTLPNRRSFLAVLTAWLLPILAVAQPDLSEFRTLDKAITAKVDFAGPGKAVSPGHLGISVKADGKELAVSLIQAGSPAEQAGIKVGDVLLKADATPLATPEALREFLQSKGSGAKIALTLQR